MLLLTLFLFFAEPNVQEFKATLNETGEAFVQLEWRVNNDVQAESYIVKRKMVRDTDFVEIAKMNSNKLDGNSRYSYSDRHIFKSTAESEPITYMLYYVDSNGSVKALAQTDINYTSTAVRRTWGSIKAMFQ